MVIAWKNLTAEPWRKGGGVTRQVLSRRLADSGGWIPAEHDWDWRLSIADVDSSGPFSAFPGMTRILTVIEGAGITLTVDGRVENLERYRPFVFDGGAETSAALPHGPIRDLNLIARTGTVSADVTIEHVDARRPLLMEGSNYCILLLGQAVLRPAADSEFDRAVAVDLERYDTVLGTAAFQHSITGDGVVAVISIAAVAGAADALSRPDRPGLR